MIEVRITWEATNGQGMSTYLVNIEPASPFDQAAFSKAIVRSLEELAKEPTNGAASYIHAKTAPPLGQVLEP